MRKVWIPSSLARLGTSAPQRGRVAPQLGLLAPQLNAASRSRTLGFFFWAAAAVLILPSSSFAASILATSQARTVSGSASASDDSTNDSDSDSDLAPDFAPFQSAVSGNASVPNALGTGGGQQDSTITETSIVATGSAFATAEAFDFDGVADGSGSSSLSVTFSVPTEAQFSLRGMVAAFDSGNVEVRLSDQSSTLASFSSSGIETPFDQTLTLPSGSYTLVADASGSTFADSFGSDFAFAEYDVTFEALSAGPSPVPILDGWGFAILGLLVLGGGFVVLRRDL